MSVEDDKAFDDQIEKMKLKNQHILEKFQASEEDRKRAENHGSTIKKDQNMSIRVKPEDIPRLRNNRPNMPRPKSFHDKIYQEDQFHSSYNQFNDNRKSIKLKNNKFNEERAYQDYMHFQQVYSNKNCNNFNRPVHRQNSHPNYTEELNIQNLAHQDFNKFNNQNMRNRSSQRFAQINQNSKTFKENDFYNPNYARITKDNEFHSQSFQNMKFQRENDNFHHYNSKYTKDNDFHSNPQKSTKENEYNNYKVNSHHNKEQFQKPKENEYHNYKVNAHHNKEQFQKPYNGNSNQNSKRRSKSKTNPNNNNTKPIINGSGDSNSNTKKSLLDDEYIDDTLEDLEQYRLKVDMEDFIVIDPESPDPILAMPLKPWTNNEVLNDLDANKSDSECKLTELSAHLLNNANMRAKDYFNLVDQNAIEHISCAEFNGQSEFDKNTVDSSKSVISINDEFTNNTKLSDEENVPNPISEDNENNCESNGIEENCTQINVENQQVNEILESNKIENQQLEKDVIDSEKEITNSNGISAGNTTNSEHDPSGSNDE